MDGETEDKVREIIMRARSALARARRGLSEASVNGPDIQRQLDGAHTLLTSGRAVTFALQNLRGPLGKADFDRWYEPYQRWMASDEVAVSFRDLRNELEKKGVESAVPSINLALLPEEIRDQIHVEWDEPERTVKWITVPPTLSHTAIIPALGIRLDKPPATHHGEPLSDFSIGAVGTLYLDDLESLIDAATKRFLPND